MLKNIYAKMITFLQLLKTPKNMKKRQKSQKNVIFDQNREKNPIFDPFLKIGLA